MARSNTDKRQYVRFAIDLPINPKVVRLNNPAAGWAYVTSVCYSGGSFTDGHFPVDLVMRLAGTPKKVTAALVKAGLWHLPGHDCVTCPQPIDGDAVIHDYLQHQRSAADAEAMAEKRRAAGKKGATARWSEDGEPDANRMANAMANGKQTDGTSMAEERRGEERNKEHTSKREVKSEAEPPGWDEFWAAVPRKAGKAAAKKAYAKALTLPDVTPDLLTAAMTSYARQMATERRPKEKIKMPQGWLNDQRWEDETEQAMLPTVGDPHAGYWR